MFRELIGLLVGGLLLSLACVPGREDSTSGPPGGAARSTTRLTSVELSALSAPEFQLARTFRFHSPSLDQERTLFVHLPEGYGDSTKTYPVHYVLDGEILFRLVAANVEFLAEDRAVDMLMPETIVIGVANVVRNTDYTPTQGTESERKTYSHRGGGASFLSFLTEELIPLVDASFRTNGYRLLTGWSFSGLFTIYVMTERPELFNAYHAISGSLWWDDNLVIEAFEGDAFARPTKLFTSVGSIEAGGKTYAANKQLARRLTDRPVENLEFTHVEIADVGHHLGVPQSIDRALRMFYEDYLPPDEVRLSGWESVEQYYRELSRSYGYEVTIPYRVYEAIGMSFWEEGEDKAQAVEVFQECVEMYPAYPMAHFWLGLAYEDVKDYRRAADSISTALEIEGRRALPDASGLLLFQGRLDRVEKELKEK